MDPWLHFPAAPAPPAADADPSAPVDIDALGLALAAAAVGVLAALSAWLRLGLHARLAVAAARCVAQLSALGYVLGPVFRADSPAATAAWAAAMLGVAAAEAASRPALAYPGMLGHAALALGGAASGTMLFGLAAVLRLRPWWTARYAIPLLGMVLGNACSGVAVGLATVLDELSARRDRVEALLAAGATRGEASADAVRRAARVALTPLLNMMSVVGIVSIPGMMTGQVLGGSPPLLAARYQIVVIFLIGAATGLASVATIHAAARSVLDSSHRLRPERLAPRAGGAGAGAGAWAAAAAARAWRGARAGARRARRRLGGAARGHTPARARHGFMGFRAAGGGSGGAARARAEGSPPPTPTLSGVRAGGEEEGGAAALAEPLLCGGSPPRTP